MRPIFCPECYKAGEEVEMEPRHHLYDVNTAGSQPDCDWLECLECGYTTEPE